MYKPFTIDGKIVRRWLFVYQQTVVAPSGARVNKAVEVEALTLDHAWKRILENYPETQRKLWEMVQELEAEHDIGQMGDKLPLFPTGSNRQH